MSILSLPAEVLGYFDAFMGCQKGKTVKTFPRYVRPQRFVSVKLECEIPTKIEVSDESLNQALIIIGCSLRGIYRAYKRTHLFGDPELIIRPNSTEFVLKVGVLEKSRWREMNKKEKTIK